MSSQTIELKTAPQLYQIAPDLQIIAERLEHSVTSAEAENVRLSAAKRKNRDTPGAASYNFKPRNPEHFRIVEIQNKQGRWERIPSELKNGREPFERDITSIASMRSPQAMKIEIYAGKKKTRNPEVFTIYLEEAAKNKSEEEKLLGKTQEAERVADMEQKFVAINQAHGNPQSVEKISADFQLQVKEYKHQNEINELKRAHEREIEKLDREIEKLEDEIEGLEEDLLESESTNLGSAALIEAKKKPSTFLELGIGMLVGAAEKWAIDHPKYMSAVTNKSEEEIRQLILGDSEANEERRTKEIKSDGNASFTETDENNEYEGFEKEHADKIKMAHDFLKRLSKEDFLTIFNILAFCNMPPDGDMYKEHAAILTQFIFETTAKEKNNANGN